MTSPLNSLSSHLVRRWKHLDPPGLWLSVFSGSAIVHLLILGVSSRISIEPSGDNSDLVAVDLVERPIENVAPIPAEPSVQPPIPTQPTISNPPTPTQPTTSNPPIPTAEQPTPISPTPSFPENPIDSPTPETELPTEQPPTPDSSREPISEEVPPPEENSTPPPTNPTPQPPSAEPTESTGDSQTSTDNPSEQTTPDSVRVTLISVTGVAAYEGSCAYSDNSTICLGQPIDYPSFDGQCYGSLNVSVILSDRLHDRGTVLGLSTYTSPILNGEPIAPTDPCYAWVDTMVTNWSFQTDTNPEGVFSSGELRLQLQVDSP